MVKKFFRKANSLLLAAAMTVTMIPAQAASAAGTEDAVTPGIVVQADDTDDSVLSVASITGKDYTVIEGNIPVLPNKAKLSNGTVAQIQWNDWNFLSLEAGKKHAVKGMAGTTEITVNVNVLPCDEVVADAVATGKQDDTEEEKAKAIHPLKGYKGKFVAEYDLAADDSGFTDRAVIYLPAAPAPNDHDGVFQADCAWDYGARLLFKQECSGSRYFQASDGDGNGDKQDLPSAATIQEQIDHAGKASVPKMEVGKVYRVRTVMDTTSDTTKGNFKIYVTDPDGVEYEVTGQGGYGFRRYPTDGIIKNFATVRGGYILTNHKISWTEGYVTKTTEIYLKEKDATDFVKGEDVTTKELPGAASEEPDAKIVRNNNSYTLVSADDGKAYYEYENAVNKSDLTEKIDAADDLTEKQADYTAATWKAFKDALIRANYAKTSKAVSQTAVTEAAETLDAAQNALVSIKDLKKAVDDLQSELDAKAAQKDDYANWSDVERKLNSAKSVLDDADATATQISSAKDSLDGVQLITKTEQAKTEMDSSVAAAEKKMTEVNQADYTPKSWKALTDALKECKDLPATAAKDDYDAKKQALDTAVKGLTLLADKTELKQAITDAEAKDEADYLAASWSEMYEKLTAAKAVEANADAEQTEVNAAKGDLVEAIQNLKLAVKSITPKKTSYSVKAGKTLNLKNVFTVAPTNAENKTLTYSIDKKYKAYASVNKSSGVVSTTKKGAGKTIVVKATAADGRGKSGTVKIKITKVAVKKVAIKGSKSVKAGKKVTLKATVTPKDATNTTVTWSIAKKYKKYASVTSKGVVKTKKAGKGKTIKVTATSKDNKKKKATISIKIK